jgi:hypothetical protein
MDQDARADVCLCRISGVGKTHKARSIMLLDVWAELRMLFALYIGISSDIRYKVLVITISIV